MQRVLVVKDERYKKHLDGVPHLESPRRMEAINSILQDPSLEDKWSGLTPRPATVEELAFVHTREHIEKVAQSAGRKLSSFDLDTQGSAESYEVARLAAGGVLAMLDKILNSEAKRGFAMIRPPGHHAEPDKAMGFCLFNNAALGARYLKETYGAKKVMIVDIDVHHGNGTQAAFYDTDDVLYVSMHQFPFYPGTGNFGEVGHGQGEGYTVNVPLPKGLGDNDFARIIHFLISPLAHEYRPEIILVSCGFDLYLYDRMSGMMVSPEGYALITFLLLELAERVCNGRIAFVMEGGYNLRGIRECGLRVMQELCDVPTLWKDRIEKVTEYPKRKLDLINKVVDIQKKYWGISL